MHSKVTAKGQVTIPQAVRKELGLQPGDEVEFVKEDGQFHLRKRLLESPWRKWSGFLKHLEGQDIDELIKDMRGE